MCLSTYQCFQKNNILYSKRFDFPLSTSGQHVVLNLVDDAITSFVIDHYNLENYIDLPSLILLEKMRIHRVNGKIRITVLFIIVETFQSISIDLIKTEFDTGERNFINKRLNEWVENIKKILGNKHCPVHSFSSTNRKLPVVVTNDAKTDTKSFFQISCTWLQFKIDLDDRHQYQFFNKRVNNLKSKLFFQITRCLPDGSILGPLLFAIYTNNFFRAPEKLCLRTTETYRSRTQIQIFFLS